MSEIEHLTEQSFTATVAETRGPLIVDFWAEWCGPCRVLGPIVERVAREHPEITVADFGRAHELIDRARVDASAFLDGARDGTIPFSMHAERLRPHEHAAPGTGP